MTQEGSFPSHLARVFCLAAALAALACSVDNRGLGAGSGGVEGVGGDSRSATGGVMGGGENGTGGAVVATGGFTVGGVGGLVGIGTGDRGGAGGPFPAGHGGSTGAVGGHGGNTIGSHGGTPASSTGGTGGQAGQSPGDAGQDGTGGNTPPGTGGQVAASGGSSTGGTSTGGTSTGGTSTGGNGTGGTSTGGSVNTTGSGGSGLGGMAGGAGGAPSCGPGNCTNGCCNGTTCVPMRTADHCGNFGAACVKCAKCFRCGASNSCEVEPTSTWKLVCVSAVIAATQADGKVWDPQAAMSDPANAKPDPFCQLKLNATTMTTTSTKMDTLTPMWNESITPASPSVPASRLMSQATPWSINLYDEDTSADDTICQLSPQLSGTAFAAGTVTLSGALCPSLVVNLTCAL